MTGKKLLIVGAGGFAPEVEEIACMNGYDEVAFLDDHPEKARCAPVIGSMADISKFSSEYEEAIVALGNNQNRLRLHKQLLENGYRVPVLIHSTAYVSKDSRIAPGCIIRAHAVVSRSVKLEQAVILNVGALVDHHCEIGEGSHILMGAVVRNEIKLPPLTWISSNEVAE